MNSAHLENAIFKQLSDAQALRAANAKSTFFAKPSSNRVRCSDRLILENDQVQVMDLLRVDLDERKAVPSVA